jgi:SAM-dependent methyltransferase
VQVGNEHYNRRGGREAAEFRFPYPDQEFDFAVATSLFTHLESTDAAHYLREISRVLKPGGRALITWYISDIPADQADFDFFHPLNAVSTTSNPKNPCAAIAFTSDFIRDHCSDASLHLETEPFPGSWRGIDGPTYQDMIVVTRGDDKR